MQPVLQGFAVFPAVLPAHPLWRGGSSPTLHPGEYLADDLEAAVWYAANFTRKGYVTAFDLTGAKVLDATERPLAVLAAATDVEDFGEYDEPWEVLENVPGVIEALQAQGYSLVRFIDAAPRAVVAYKYIGRHPVQGVPVAKELTPAEAAQVIDAECLRLWQRPGCLPHSPQGLAALEDAQADERGGWGVDSPEDYLQFAKPPTELPDAMTLEELITS